MTDVQAALKKAKGDPAMIIPDEASQKARDAIAACRTAMYDPTAKDAYRAVLTGADTLVKSAYPFVAQLVTEVEQRTGGLNSADLDMVVYCVAGSIVADARAAGDPDVQTDDDVKQAASDIHDEVIRVMGANQDGQEMSAGGMDQQQMGQGQPQQPQGPLGQLG